MRKILFSRESACLQPLRALVMRQKHRTLAIWAIDCAAPYLEMFEKRYPEEARPREALTKATAWMRGEIKMPEAKAAIHAAHNAATAAEHDPAACAAARAVAHAAATVHVETHGLGLAFYGLTALSYLMPPEEIDGAVGKECERLYGRLLYWEAHVDSAPRPFAKFLLKEGVPNKEWLFDQKQLL